MKNLDLHIEDEGFSVFPTFIEVNDEDPELIAEYYDSLESEEGFDHFLTDLLVNKKVIPEKGDQFVWGINTNNGRVAEFTLVIVDVEYVFYKGKMNLIRVYLKTI